MHKLNRDCEAPVCLSRYKHNRDQWTITSPTGEERNEIWTKLEKMQGQRCAYCEAAISRDPNKSHIEHFRNRNKHPEDTFNWNNLFGSCTRKEGCGHGKDNSKLTGVYNPADLIKPDIDDPDDFFVFVFDGTIKVKQGLSRIDLRRANETLRVFQLDAETGPLRQMRKNAAAGYLETAQQIATEYSSEEGWDFLQEEIKNTHHLPFATVIRHVLTSSL